jgi:hypothetical protein
MPSVRITFPGRWLAVFLSCLFVLLGAGCLFAGPVEDWQEFEAAVRDGRIPRNEAELELDALVHQLSSYMTDHFELESAEWAFPLKGYTIKALDKYAFQPQIRYGPHNVKGYDFFDGNRHGGHPAYDIFIKDRDQDCLDDRTGEPADVVAVMDSVVLSVHTGWQIDSPIRGGNYLWLYNPGENAFYYYAHLQDIFVEPGQAVTRGERIATVGRTGVLAAQKRSPTHLHFMVLTCKDGKLVPVNTYPRLTHTAP